VEELLRTIVGSDFSAGWYKSEIITPLNLDKILDRKLNSLSGGELQRVAISACLSKHASLYLLDEPSAYLDVEERLSMTRTIRRLVEERGASAFIVEHDIVAQDFLSDNIMVFEGIPGVKSVALKPLTLREGMNRFLEDMSITFRRDPDSKRPRVNKEGSRLDREQKSQKEYYYIPKEEISL
jgi:ATP-binding cassette subfamily E protein 1